MTRLPPCYAVDAQDAGLARVLEAALVALDQHVPATLAVVLETEGSTYARAGTVVLFTDAGHAGWLSGGCLEPEIERAARHAAMTATIGWMEIDTRDDAALFSGNAVGCRGCQRVALLPLQAISDGSPAFRAWLDGTGPLQLTLDRRGGLQLSCGGAVIERVLSADEAGFHSEQGLWHLRWMPPPRVLVLGAGPEAMALVPGLRGLGWQVRLTDPRETWRSRCPVASEPMSASAALTGAVPSPDAALVMHHNFELDLQALEALAATSTPFIGLLGPRRRRDDLFSLLPADLHAGLHGRLRSPVGLDLGGRGPEAIALSITAELQAWRHGTALCEL